MRHLAPLRIYRSHPGRFSAFALLPVIIATVTCASDVEPVAEPSAPARANTEVAANTLTATDPSTANLGSLGQEIAVPRHLADGEEQTLSLADLLGQGRSLFTAVFTPQDGGGRPLTKGNGNPIADPSDPLVFPRNFNRISAMDSNACTSCHSIPFTGGGGHFSANAFIPGQRFDFITFDHAVTIPTKATFDERGVATTLIPYSTGTNSATNSRASIGMFGSGFIEMHSRQITTDLQRIRDAIPPGGSSALTSKGIDYGRIARGVDGSWDTSGVVGISKQSLVTTGPSNPPTLVVRPFHQQSLVVSIREFTNNAMNHHHGMQSVERFGRDTDPDGDGFKNELTIGDITATAVFQATLAVPGRVIPNNSTIEQAVLNGEKKFGQIGCATCHRPTLPLTNNGWIFSEPNPFNPPTNLRPGDAPTLSVDLTNLALPNPRLAVQQGVVNVPAFTDLKLHNITASPTDPGCDPIDMSEPATVAGQPNPKFFAGTCYFITKKLWGSANEPPFFHHGKFTTLREAILAHAGEAQASADAYRALSAYNRASIIEFLKTLQVLQPGTRYLAVDELGNKKTWPPAN